MHVRWTEKASADALGIFDYIADQSLAYAESVYERILERPVQLTIHPRLGSVVPELGRDDIRELFVYSFRLIYRIAGDEIRVLTVIHGSTKIVAGDAWRGRTMKCTRGRGSRFLGLRASRSPVPRDFHRYVAKLIIESIRKWTLTNYKENLRIFRTVSVLCSRLRAPREFCLCTSKPRSRLLMYPRGRSNLVGEFSRGRLVMMNVTEARKR